MIKVQGKLPKELVVAVSGGVDSMAVLDFLRRNHNVMIQFVHHGTEASKLGDKHIREYAKLHKLDLAVDYISSNIPKGVSQEEHWRNERYRVFHGWDIPVITAHHLNDCVETWIWSSLHGEGKIIPYRNQNVIRPFRLNKKEEFEKWCVNHNVSWIEDESNSDTKYMRNYIRHKLMPGIKIVNPGIEKVIKKKILRDMIEHTL